MSHFSSIRTVLNDRASLKTGLTRVLEAYKIQAPIEDHETPALLINHYDRRDQKYAHLIIRRQYLNTEDRQALIDIGFLQDDSGIFQLQIDAWDFQRNLLGQQFGDLPTFIHQVQIETERAFVETQFPVQLWDYEALEHLPDGSIRLVMHGKPNIETVAAW